MDNFDTGIGPMNQPGMGAPSAPGAGYDPSNLQALRDRIAAMPPGQQKDAALAELLRNYPGEMQALESRTSAADEMAATPMPQGTHLGGRYATYTAASPVEHLASALRQYSGMKAGKKARDEAEELRKAQEAMREKIARAGLGGGTQGGMYNRLP